jgi:sodium transport system permease protein
MHMNWSKVRLIFLRETKDQLRDRRTLFTILVLPLLLYPMMAMVMLQVSQFMSEHPTQVKLIGVPESDQLPPLLDGFSFHPDFGSPRENRLIVLTLEPAPEWLGSLPGVSGAPDPADWIERDIRTGRFDAVVWFPEDFAGQLLAFRESLQGESDTGGNARENRAAAEKSLEIPSPRIFVNSASDKSRIAGDRVEQVLLRWREAIVHDNLGARGIPRVAIQPFRFRQMDVAKEPTRRALLWSKFMPFVVLVWALTGAFYPAVDLCAGEKERGTLETLLSSPAERSEIVWGKLLTVMGFSIATSLLNMASMGATVTVLMRQFAAGSDVPQLLQVGPPPWSSVLWIVMALLPTSALFSALALAIAAFARSSKEGHYYLMPLLFFALPLMLFPTLPMVELSLGTSIIPLAGLMLLLRTAIEGEYVQAAIYFVPVTLVTAFCCLVSIRWAIDQFSSESVLFRENERGGMGAWIRHAFRQRRETPTVFLAILVGLFLLILKFLASPSMKTPETAGDLVLVLLVTQLGMIAFPALLFTFLLTKSPRQTLLWRQPPWMALPAAVALGFLLNPVVFWLGIGVEALYPLDAEALERLAPLARIIQSDFPWWLAVLLIGLLPAVCEELAFRGFILSGLRHLGHRWGAIIVTAVFFGLTHGIVQQQMTATVIGIVIGYLAVQSGSLFPAILYHFTHNSLVVLSSRMSPETLKSQSWLEWIFAVRGDSLLVHWPVAIVTGVLGLGILAWFHRLPLQRSAEEELTRALDHQLRSARELPAQDRGGV